MYVQLYIHPYSGLFVQLYKCSTSRGARLGKVPPSLAGAGGRVRCVSVRPMKAMKPGKAGRPGGETQESELATNSYASEAVTPDNHECLWISMEVMFFQSTTQSNKVRSIEEHGVF